MLVDTDKLVKIFNKAKKVATNISEVWQEDEEPEKPAAPAPPAPSPVAPNPAPAPPVQPPPSPVSVSPPEAPQTFNCIDEDGLSIFFDAVRVGPVLGPVLSQGEVDGCVIILGACSVLSIPVAWVAYILATAFHETAGYMWPVREFGRGKGRAYGVPGHNNNQVAYGRGFVQLTWDRNYERADKELGLNGRLIANYDLALDPHIAGQILVNGMMLGWFTGKKLSDYLPPGHADIHQFANARQIINGLDRAAEIGAYALSFQDALTVSWKC